MNIKNLGSPSFEQISDLFTNYTFSIPSYQRKYSWGNDEALDLLYDIFQVAKGNEKHHFFGSVVTYKSDPNKKTSVKIVDGQQRITTSLVLLSVISDLTKKLINRFPISKINAFDPIGKKLNKMYGTLPKMLLNDKKPTLTVQKSHAEKQEQKYSDFFNWIITKRGIESNFIDRNYKPIKLLRRVRRTLQRTLRHKIRYSKANSDKLNSLNEQIIALYKIYNAFVNNFYVVILGAPSRSEALTIYMTLNNRGKDLSNADIVKSHLAGVLEDNDKGNEISKIMRKWNKMSTILDSDTRVISHFIGEYWAASHNYASGSQLSRNIIHKITTPKATINMINELLSLAPVYSTLRNPKINSVYQNNKLIKNIIILNNLRLVQYYPVILAMYHHKNRFSEKDVLTVLNTVNNIEMRHLVHSVHHTKYEKVSNKIWHNELYSTKDIITWMNSKQLVNDDVTRSNCISYSHTLNKSGSGLKALKLMLSKNYAYTNKQDFKGGQLIYNDIFSDPYKYYVIHITHKVSDEIIDYLGNYVLLEAHLYRKYNKSHDLISCLKQSKLITNQKIGNVLKNNTTNLTDFIIDRQNEFADNYIHIWK